MAGPRNQHKLRLKGLRKYNREIPFYNKIRSGSGGKYTDHSSGQHNDYFSFLYCAGRNKCPMGSKFHTPRWKISLVKHNFNLCVPEMTIDFPYFISVEIFRPASRVKIKFKNDVTGSAGAEENLVAVGLKDALVTITRK